MIQLYLRAAQYFQPKHKAARLRDLKMYSLSRWQKLLIPLWSVR